jgi:hypothetical protein
MTVQDFDEYVGECPPTPVKFGLRGLGYVSLRP